MWDWVQGFVDALASLGATKLFLALGAILVVSGICALLYNQFDWWVLAPRRRKTEAERDAKLGAILARLQAGSGPQAEVIGKAVTYAQGQATAGDTRFGKALQLLNAGKDKEAEPLFLEDAEEQAALGAAANARAAEAFRRAGAIAYLSDPKKARSRYARAVELNPQDAESQMLLGFLLVEAGELTAAESAYLKVLALGNQGTTPTDIYWARLGLGDIAMQRGDLPEALEGYRMAGTFAADQLKSDPGNAGWQRDLSVSYEKIGDVQVAQGDGAGALKSYRDSLALRERLAASDPGNAGWQRDLSVSNEKIGDVQVAQGDGAGALKSYRDSLALRERLAASDPGNAGWQRDLSVSYEKIGDVQVAQGDGAGALKSYRDSLALRERLAASDPGNAGWQRDLSVSYDRIGDVQVAQGDGAGALKSYRDGLAIAERLAASDSGNAGWQRDLSVSYDRIGDVQVAQGDGAGALKSYRDSLALRERLAASDPGNADWQRDLIVSYAKLAGVFPGQGWWAKARDVARQLASEGRLAPVDLWMVADTEAKAATEGG